MIKKILCLALALVVIASMAVIGVSAAADTTIYFEVPADWTDTTAVYCHIWAYGGDSLAAWQSKKEKCTAVEGNLYSYDVTKVGGLEAGAFYGVIFSNNNAMQTYDTLMTDACYGDTLYCDGTLYENPQDSSKTCQAAFWKNQDPAVYGPVMQITSIGNLIGTCLPPGVTAESLFNSFLVDWLESAREYSGKDDQTIIDDIIASLGLTDEKAAELIAAAGVEVAWEGAAPATTVAPTTAAPKATIKAGADTYEAAVGDVITYTFNVTTPDKIENVQASTTYDATVLKLVDAPNTERFPVLTGLVANAQEGAIYFNASDISTGFDFTAGGTLISLQFEVLAVADTEVKTVIEEMVQFFGTDYVTGGEVVEGVEIGTTDTVVVPEPEVTTTVAETTVAETTVAETTVSEPAEDITTAPADDDVTEPAETEPAETTPVETEPVEDEEIATPDEPATEDEPATDDETATEDEPVIDEPVIDEPVIDEPVVEPETDAQGATDAPADKPADTVPTGVAATIYVVLAFIAMAAAAAVVLRKKANG